MANEIQITGVLTYTNPAVSASPHTMFVSGKRVSTQGGPNVAHSTMSVPTTAGGAAIPIGNLAGPGRFAIKNNDASHYVEILSAVNGTVMLEIPPGEIAIGCFGRLIAAPAALANTAAVSIEFEILERVLVP